MNDLFGDHFEARQQAAISQCARRIGSDPEALAYALKRASLDTLLELCERLIAAETVEESQLALSLFTNNVAREEA